MRIVEATGKIPSTFFDVYADDEDWKGVEFDLKRAKKYKDRISIFHFSGPGNIYEEVPKGFTEFFITENKKDTYVCFTKNIASNELNLLIDFI